MNDFQICNTNSNFVEVFMEEWAEQIGKQKCEKKILEKYSRIIDGQCLHCMAYWKLISIILECIEHNSVCANRYHMEFWWERAK